jgi:LAO/AO transport system kinase
MSRTESILEGNRLSLARLLTQVENDSPEGRTALGELFPHTGKAHLIGVTGAPGTGKSSLVNQLALGYRRNADKKVAIVAVDPSSPFTGGAVLGDRVRMRDLSGDEGVFIRSMASRGSLGGIAQKTASIVQVFDAAGYEIIIIETVGGLGDEIQAIKAGILEIADVLVINKADRPGVENTERALRSTLELAHPTKRVFRHHGKAMTVLAPSTDSDIWIPPIVKTVAPEGKGVDELIAAIAKHAAHLQQSGNRAERDRARLESEMEAILQDALMDRFMQDLPREKYQEIIERVVSRNISPYEAVKSLLNGNPK